MSSRKRSPTNFPSPSRRGMDNTLDQRDHSWSGAAKTRRTEPQLLLPPGGGLADVNLTNSAFYGDARQQQQLPQLHHHQQHHQQQQQQQTGSLSNSMEELLANANRFMGAGAGGAPGAMTSGGSAGDALNMSMHMHMHHPSNHNNSNIISNSDLQAVLRHQQWLAAGGAGAVPSAQNTPAFSSSSVYSLGADDNSAAAAANANTNSNTSHHHQSSNLERAQLEAAILGRSFPNPSMQGLSAAAFFSNSALSFSNSAHQHHHSYDLLRSLTGAGNGGFLDAAPFLTPPSIFPAAHSGGSANNNSRNAALFGALSSTTRAGMAGGDGLGGGLGARGAAPGFASAINADVGAANDLPPLAVTEHPLSVPMHDLPPQVPPASVNAPTDHWSDRYHVPLAIDEDHNWLSEFQCFIREEILEVFRANHDDLKVRNNSKSLSIQQVGIRCRFCAHIAPSARTPRSSAFPSSTSQIYQSFTMMLRDHFAKCQAIPQNTQELFVQLKKKSSQGASDSKNYWVHAARRLGMVDTPDGIQITETTRVAATLIPNYGSAAGANPEADNGVDLVQPRDQGLASEFLFHLLSQCQRVTLTKSEHIGCRTNLKIGLAGIGCKFCCKAGRFGLSRVFAARRRTLPSKMGDLYSHIQRCPLVPQETKALLERMQDNHSDNDGGPFKKTQGHDKEFFNRLWSRLGHSETDPAVGLEISRPSPVA